MPTIRHIIKGLAVGTALAGGLVTLGTITTTTAANATIVPQQFDDGFLDRPIRFDGLIGDAVIRSVATAVSAFNAVPIQADLHNADFSRTDINSFDRQTAVQRLGQRNDD